MLRRPRWIRYAPDKTPLRINGRHASSTDPATWSTYAEALGSRAGIGLGYVLGDGIGCIDLDHCLTENGLVPVAADFIAAYSRHYIEISPSGDGLHIWGAADEQKGTRRAINGLHLERYSVGRYITVTGNVYQHGSLQPLDVTAIPVSASLSV